MMCGINGILYFTDRHDGSLERMNDALAHRGPNDAGIWKEGAVQLGHRRLSIIDLSAAGHQPMQSDDGRYVIIFNGEIYNYRQLRAELPSYPYRSQTDTEVLLAAYAAWGSECLQRLNGMFAFAIWDRAEATLFVARDRLGIKPLYYYQDEHRLVFSSEVRGLLASGVVPRQLDEASLIDYLRYQTVHGPKTILEGVKLLPAGHFLQVVTAQATIAPYWTARPKAEFLNAERSSAEWQREIKLHLLRAVERRLVADVPFGAFLSGGIDSSAIVALMSQVATEPVNTFCVTFAEAAFSEARYARQVAEKFGTRHHEIPLRPENFLDTLPAALNAMDHPSGDGPNTYIVSQATRAAGITMALSGLGGDELFAGYPIFRQSYRLAQWSTLNILPQPLRRLAGQVVATARPTVAGRKTAEVLALSEVHPLEAYPLARQVLLDDQIRHLTDRDKLPANSVQVLARQLREVDWPVLSQISVAEIISYMQHVLLRDTDQMSMAHALEVRVPFLDHELVELVLAIPDSIKYPHTPKQLLVAAMGDLLPAEIVNRPKMGFTLPFSDWMRGELWSFCDQHLRRLAGRSRFNESYLLKLWSDFLAGHPGISWSRLWTLVVLEHWLDTNRIE